MAENTTLTVTCNPTTPPTLGKNVFTDTALEVIYVPEGTVSTYQAADGWSDYSSIISKMITF